MDDLYRDLLHAMQVDSEKAEPQYQPTYYWKICSDRITGDLDRHGLENFRAMPAALMHFVPTYIFGDLAPFPEKQQAVAKALKDAAPDSPKTQLWLDELLTGRMLAAADYRVFRASYRDRAPHFDHADESKIGTPVGQSSIEGRNFSRSMLNYLLGLNFLKEHVSDVPCRTVLEIGGGFGTLGEILLTDSRNDTFYINVDIPPTALFSTYYLRQVLGEDRVIDYLQSRDQEQIEIEKFRSDGKAAVMCAWQLPKLRGKVDIFVNFISFQEIEPEVVEGYLQQVSRLESKYVLLRNIREGRELARNDGDLGMQQATVAEDYDRFLPNYDLVATNVIPYGFATVDGFHSELRLYRRR